MALHARVAAEGIHIATEAPVDPERSRASFEKTILGDAGATLVAEADGEIVGTLGVITGRYGFADIGMVVDEAWRGRGVGSALVAAAIDWARGHGVHKLALHVWPRNEAALALYRKFGFEEEGLLRAHYRRRSGERWDAIVMGLLLDEEEG